MTTLFSPSGPPVPSDPSGSAGASSVPFRSGEDGYDTFRVPALLTTPAGTLLAFAEGRLDSPGDTGDIDVVVKRSTDGGATWGPPLVVAVGDGDTRGNPAPVIDPASGRLVVVTCFNSGDATEEHITRGAVDKDASRRVFVQTSDDDGRTFSAPRDITAEVKRPGWRWYATGPGHALALTGKHAGRLVVPANHSAAPPDGSSDTGAEPHYYGAHCLYSDDGGDSWHIGYVDDDYSGVTNTNESSLAQLPDGRLYVTSRDQHGSSPGNRMDSYSSDGGATLDQPFAPQPTLDAVPVVQGSVLQVAGAGGAPLLFSGPATPDARAAMTVWRSDDGGATFRKAMTLSDQPAAYSDLVQLDARTVGILYETGVADPYETLTFRRIPLADLD